MNRDANAARFMQQVANDATLSPDALTVAAAMADKITGHRLVVVTNWRNVWQASGLLRGQTLDAIKELTEARHIGQRQDSWNQAPGYPVRLHAGVPA